jgi:hypothetical protein
MNFDSSATSVKWSEPVSIEALNSAEDEFAPVWDRYREILIFNSTIDKYSRFYSSRLLDSINWSAPQLIKDEINQSGKNQSYLSIANEDMAVYSAYSLKYDRSYINLFTAYYKKGQWNRSGDISSLNGDYFIAHSAISPDANFMVYVSDNGNKNLETDLWIAYKKDDGTWGDQTPLSSLNSPGNEISPYLKSADSLYFASDGLGGPGGYDLYLSVRQDGVWKRPTPLIGLNTKFDESDLTFYKDSLYLFSSNRPGGKGGYDLFSTHLENYSIDDEGKGELDFTVYSPIYSLKFDCIEKYDVEIPYFSIRLSTLGKLDSLTKLLSKKIKNAEYDNLKISIFAKNENIGELKSLLIKKLNIDEKDITLKIDNKIKDDYAVLKIEGDKFYFKKSNDKLVFTPQQIEISYKSRPENLFANCYALLLNKDEDSLRQIGAFTYPSSSFIIDLDSLSGLTRADDKLNIRMFAFDKKGEKYIQDMQFHISGKTSGERNKYTFNNKEYFKIVLNNFQDAPEIEETLEQVIIANQSEEVYLKVNQNEKDSLNYLIESLKRICLKHKIAFSFTFSDDQSELFYK